MSILYFKYILSILIIFFVMFLYSLYRGDKKGVIVSSTLLFFATLMELFLFFNFVDLNEKKKPNFKLYEKNLIKKEKKLIKANFKSFKRKEKEFINKIENLKETFNKSLDSSK